MHVGDANHHDVVHHDEHGAHGHDDHHGHDVAKADLDHKFIESGDKKYIFFNGLRATEPASIVIENPYRHHNDLPLTQYIHILVINYVL